MSEEFHKPHGCCYKKIWFDTGETAGAGIPIKKIQRIGHLFGEEPGFAVWIEGVSGPIHCRYTTNAEANFHRDRLISMIEKGSGVN